MTGKGLTWTAAHLRAASSPEDVRTAIAEAAGQLGEGSVPASMVLSLLEELALDAARVRTELRAATRVREVLLASVAHDLRNPLNTFAMSAGLLRDDLEGPDFDRTRALSLLSRMDRASSRMQALIEDLLEASRVEAGTVSVNAGTYGSEPHMPFGGVKQSGNGSREPGPEAIDFYSNLKNVYVTVTPARV